jgi:starch synthase
MHVLFVASEIVPYAKTGGRADVVGALPEALVQRGHRVTRVMPLYASVDRRAHGLRAVGRRVRVRLGGRTVAAKLAVAQHGGVETYFLDCPEFYDRPGLYTESGADYPDNAERFAFLSHATLGLCADLGLEPDLIHCHDWQAALIPAALKLNPSAHPALAGVPTVFTIHNLGYQGLFSMGQRAVFGLPDAAYTPEGLEFYGQVNLLKGGIVFADAITTVSRTYAREIQDARAGFGLEGVLSARADRLTGIVNGIDTAYWDPAHDPHLTAPFSRDRLATRARNRAALCQDMGLDPKAGPVVGMVGRLAEQKGMGLVLAALHDLLDAGISLAVLGQGEPGLVHTLREAARLHPDRIALVDGFNEPLAHRIYAGCDLFLMPSRFEPCGLAQLIAMRYGAPPVVRRVGGLADTVAPWGDDPDAATGFAFDDFTPEAVAGAVRQAVHAMRDPDAFQRIQRRGMARDFSWDQSAAEYEDVYEGLLREAREAGGRSAGAAGAGTR